MLNPFDYIYYKLHRFCENFFWRKNRSHDHALAYMSLLVGANTMSILLWIKPGANKEQIILSFVPAAAVWLIYYKRGEKIGNKYDTESFAANVFGNIATAVYALGSIALLFYTASIR